MIPALLGWFLLLPLAVYPQAASGTEADAAVASEQDAGQQPIFQVEIEEVTVPVTVTNSSGEFVTDLNPGDFKLLDNGEPQKLDGIELPGRFQAAR